MANCANPFCGSANADYAGGICDLCAMSRVTIDGVEMLLEHKTTPVSKDEVMGSQFRAYAQAANYHSQANWQQVHKELPLPPVTYSGEKDRGMVMVHSDNFGIFKVEGAQTSRISSKKPNAYEVDSNGKRIDSNDRPNWPTGSF